MKKIFTLLSIAALSTATFAQKVQLTDQAVLENGVAMPDNKAAAELFKQTANGQNGYGVAYLTNFGEAIVVADDFEIAKNSKITKITGYGFSTNATNITTITSNLLVYIYEDNAGSPKQTPDNPLMTIKMAKGSTGVTYVKSGSYVDIVLDLAAAGKTINLDAGKRYWISILPETSDANGSNRWAWFKATDQKYSGKAQLIDLGDLFGGGYTEWTDLDDILTTPWGNFGTAFALEGEDNLGVSQVLADNVVSIYPNPTSDVVNVKTLESINVKSIQIVDLTGRVVSTNMDKKSINISSLPKGTYLVKVQDTSGKTFTQKIIKK
ncbi:T9SS type A sorting domain-containing protein [Empedobacter falsenii]|jgi:hypothetical protein|uniref:T9SS type A sorting domain-containing protein n=1 Tax=Empedobacter TaxID=59734 RepID=UPI002446E6A7|nr:MULTISPECIES: T9SS type A sorting domain-containing protein [Empedobacter]MDH1883287.1 T9SS type A sorting domain-containing protein [Empedobacter sp. GD03797]MDM1042959.1 T9SS type A sorting domain-containing protein [Empedobacter brevis]MDM1136889.1 T9SS type A sorting domain-containing protein [Empedobacter sp. R750]